jgi:hypothetical protein
MGQSLDVASAKLVANFEAFTSGSAESYQYGFGVEIVVECTDASGVPAERVVLGAAAYWHVETGDVRVPTGRHHATPYAY